jgi:hypothetical protein
MFKKKGYGRTNSAKKKCNLASKNNHLVPTKTTERNKCQQQGRKEKTNHKGKIHNTKKSIRSFFCFVLRKRG